ncbi:MAG TPA: hypothetical protein RMH85_15745 [Polyangiaceae bacterium LLY-WYZ-15_(1-7)]|nr:hypothetical protein [Polyangiaceae bacterium LLY-WYZ-15_(1-7)]HJL09953.1 hypothetical protein [Polyangiaceae bacterium LLY-WYZ-15_(1-7)]HJL21569.1 hypothetical protein [Polyangiaceae bacterium LLY-WYZ-15_(1-7)]
MKRARKVGIVVAAALALVAGVVIVEGAPAEAQRIRARVFLTQARIPRTLTERGLIRFARSHNARRLRETTSQPIPEREWRANMVTSFNRPPGDLEFQVLFYHLEGGRNARFISPPLSTFVNNRDEKTFVQRLRLDREQFEPNERYELRVVVRRQEVGRTRFDLIGEEVRRSGEVSFGSDET